MVTTADLERIIGGEGTKSAKARALYALGCERTDAVELLGMNYSQAHSVWKEMQNGLPARQPRKDRSQNGTWSPTIGEVAPRRLNLRPTQVRVATQDGHEVLRDLDGTHCTECDREIGFSLRYLAFIHEKSKKEPTKLEDRYAN